MPENVIYLSKKTIKARWVIKELDLIKEETGKNYIGIVYDLFLEKLKEIHEKRNSTTVIIDDCSVREIKRKINVILDNVEKNATHKLK